jgi:hypothetical protein
MKVVDDSIFYSVEWIPKSNPWNCWNQADLCRTRLGARLALFEAKFRHGRKDNHFRIREL